MFKHFFTAPEVVAIFAIGEENNGDSGRRVSDMAVYKEGGRNGICLYVQPSIYPGFAVCRHIVVHDSVVHEPAGQGMACQAGVGNIIQMGEV